MLYCEECQRLIAPQEIEGCPECAGELREPVENDPVLLVSVPSLQATFVEPLLQDTGIPYSKVGDLGVGFTMRGGDTLEMYRFYVPYGAYDKARELIGGTLGEDPVIVEGMQS